MKLLMKLHDLDEARSIKHRLETVGLPIFIGSEKSGPAMGAMPLADCYTIWVELDVQYDCALRYLNDEKYEPVKPVDIDQYRDSQESASGEFRNKFAKVNEYILNTIMLFVVGLLGFYLLSSM